MHTSETRRRQTDVAEDHRTPPGGIVPNKLSPAAPDAKRLTLCYERD